MEKVIPFLDRENILLLGLAWDIFPQSYSRAEPAGIWVSLNHAGGEAVSLSLISPLSPELRSISRFSADGHCVRMAHS